ncbi:LysR family transcriptional regulator [Demetria terragena]|uniref:LysR family transcriptional regulator n=1 Tax=Demetria terragena TaxID=63959 RepID=UPI00058F00CD|nr:LysR family transcriptional regulator [Demetria terragena]
MRQLTYFVAVAEAGQVSAAARELYVSQSAVTTAVQGVERELGRAVFERSPRGVTLTAAGRSLLPKARQILELAREAETSAPGDTDIRGTLRVGVTYTVMGYFLPTHIHRLRLQFPHLDLQWFEMDRTSIEQQVVDGDLDLAVVLTSNVDSPKIRYETLVHSSRRLWVAPHHPLAELTEPTLADVAEFPYALLTVDEADQTTRAYWSAKPPTVYLSTSSIEAIRSLVAGGDAITVLSDMVYRPWSLEGGRIEAVVLADPVPDMDIGLAWAQGREFSPEMTVLHDYFRHVIGGRLT